MRVMILILLSFNIYANEGDKLFNLGIASRFDLNLADSLFNEAKELYIKEENYYGEANSIYYRGFCSDLKGNILEALEFYFQSKQICVKNGLKELQIINNSKISFLLSKNSLYTQALFYNNESISIIINELNSDKYLLEKAIMSEADIYYEMKNYKKSLQLLNQIHLNNNDNHFKNTYYNLLGRVQFELEMYDSALINYNKALEIDPKSKLAQLNKLELLFVQNNLLFESNLKRYEYLLNDASDYLIEFEKILFSKYEFSKGNISESIILLQDLINYCSNKNLINCEIRAYKELVNIYEEVGDIENISKTNKEVYSLLDKRNMNSVQMSNKILAKIKDIELENYLLSKDNESLQLRYYAATSIAILFILLSYLFWKYRYTKVNSEGYIFDYFVIVEKLRRIVSRQMNDLLNRNMKNLIMNYDMDQDEILFRNHEDIINVKNLMENDLEKSLNEIKSNKEAVKVLKLEVDSVNKM